MARMTQARPSEMTRFRIWLEETDLALAARGHGPLTFEAGHTLFEADLEPADAAAFVCQAFSAIGLDEEYTGD